MPSILTTFAINNVPLANRLAVAPMTRVSATASGFPTQAMHDYYLRFAEGGFGLVITEGLYTDETFSQGYRFQPGLANQQQALAWAGITQALQAHGAKVFAQLMHAGALSQGNRFCDHPVAPSAVQPRGEQMSGYYGEGRYQTPRQISPGEITEVIQGFVGSAVRAVQVSGFDGVEIHAANGYLLDQFLCPHTNLRQDSRGGDIHARASLLVDILRAVRTQLGTKVPVGIRISQGKVNDPAYKWPGGMADAQVIFSALMRAGADFIHVTEPAALRPAFAEGDHSLVALARRFAPKVAIIANGGLGSAECADRALQDGADLVAQGKAALSNPDLPQVYACAGRSRPFDATILGPIANIKASELAFRRQTP